MNSTLNFATPPFRWREIPANTDRLAYIIVGFALRPRVWDALVLALVAALTHWLSLIALV